MKNIFGRPVLSVLALMLFVSGVFAEITETERGGMGYFSLGLQPLGLDNLQERLDGSGLGTPSLGRSFLSLGGGGFFLSGRFLIGGEGLYLSGAEKTGGGYGIQMSGGYGIFQVGYTVFRRKGFSLYPLVGFGAGGMTLRIWNEQASDLSFDEVLADPALEVSLNSPVFILQVSVGADARVRIGSSSRGTGYFMLGIRIGYLYSPQGAKWEHQRQEVVGGPKLDISRPFFRLVAGWGGSSRE